MGKIVGIDLGTSNSVIGFCDNGAPKIIPNNHGETLIPSKVLLLDNGSFFVGSEAVRHIKRYEGANITIGSVKRRMGTDFKIERGNILFYPQVLSALILAELKLQAELYLNESVTQAVLAVPTNFNRLQRMLTREAAELAGIEVLRLLNEATSASLAYSYKHPHGDEMIMVYDLGGGSLDVSVIQKVGADESGVFVLEVKGVDGDTKLGGDDFDERIFEWLCQHFRKETGLALKLDDVAALRVREAAEKAKCDLSEMHLAEINIRDIVCSPPMRHSLQTTLSREAFEAMTEDLVKQAILPVSRLKGKIATETGTEIDTIILTGGATRMPQVEQGLYDLKSRTAKRAIRTVTRKKEVRTGRFAFLGIGRKIQKEIREEIPYEYVQDTSIYRGLDRDTGVAEGIIIQAGILVGDVREILLLDVLPASLAVEIEQGIARRLIGRETTIPTKKSDIFTTTEDNQSRIEIHLVEGESNLVSENESLCHLTLDGIPPAAKGVPQVEVTLDVDTNGTVSVSAKDVGTGKEVNTVTEFKYCLSEDMRNQVRLLIDEWVWRRRKELKRL